MSRAGVAPRALRRPQAGVGLIEVLIAVLVLTFGMLGMAKLMVWNLRNNQSAVERSMAVMQMYSIVDSMRADRAAALQEGFDLALDSAPAEGASFPKVALSEWRTNLLAVLGPGATGAVECDRAGDGAKCIVRVRWNDGRGTSGNTEQEISTEVRL